MCENALQKQVNIEELLEISAIQKKRYRVKTITPLMMHGWNEQPRGANPVAETRAASIKGVYRYWWRILQYETKNYKDLFQKEGKLFGHAANQSNKSKVMISIPVNEVNKGYNAVSRPHKKNTSKDVSAIINKEFDIDLSVYQKDSKHFEEFKAYFELMLLLAGFGQRSRRGAGALQQTEKKFHSIEDYKAEIQNLLQKINKMKYFNTKLNSPHHLLQVKENIPLSQSPTLRSIWIGKAFNSGEAARKAISNAGHEANKIDLKNNQRYLGNVVFNKKIRVASPLIATVREIGGKYYPIISEVITINQNHETYIKAKNDFLQWVGVKV